MHWGCVYKCGGKCGGCAHLAETGRVVGPTDTKCTGANCGALSAIAWSRSVSVRPLWSTWYTAVSQEEGIIPVTWGEATSENGAGVFLRLQVAKEGSKPCFS